VLAEAGFIERRITSRWTQRGGERCAVIQSEYCGCGAYIRRGIDAVRRAALLLDIEPDRAKEELTVETASAKRWRMSVKGVRMRDDHRDDLRGLAESLTTWRRRGCAPIADFGRVVSGRVETSPESQAGGRDHDLVEQLRALVAGGGGVGPKPTTKAREPRKRGRKQNPLVKERDDLIVELCAKGKNANDIRAELIERFGEEPSTSIDTINQIMSKRKPDIAKRRQELNENAARAAQLRPES